MQTTLLSAALLLTMALPCAMADIPPPPPKKPAAPAEPAPAADDSLTILGKWDIIQIGENGKMASAEEIAALKEQLHVEITAEWITLVKAKGKKERMSWKLDPAHQPKWIDLTIQRGEKRDLVPAPGIYELNGDTLKICFDDHPKADTPRATAFESVKDSPNDFLLVLQRASLLKIKAAPEAGTPAAALHKMLALAEKGNYAELIQTMVEPTAFKALTEDEDLETIAAEFKDDEGPGFIKALQRIKDTAPEMSADGTTAIWPLPEGIGGEDELKLFLKDGRWYIANP